MPRPQFTLRALLVLMLVVGAFLGGVIYGRHETRRELEEAFQEAEATRSAAHNELKRILARELFGR
jgi:hypothetical protein